MTSKRERPDAAPEGATFESMMERLESLVARLEEGNLSLEESIHAFEEGVTLVKKCTAVLNEAEGRVQRLTRDAAGAPKTEPLEGGDPDRDDRSDELPF
jgi:exodeoxyribonuclease VII small subunit